MTIAVGAQPSMAFETAFAVLPAAPVLAGVGTAVAGNPYSQQELLDLFAIADPRCGRWR